MGDLKAALSIFAICGLVCVMFPLSVPLSFIALMAGLPRPGVVGWLLTTVLLWSVVGQFYFRFRNPRRAN